MKTSPTKIAPITKYWVFLLVLLLAFSLALPAQAAFLVQDESQALREAFAAAAFRAEYDVQGRDELRRWQSPIRVYTTGTPTAQDLATLATFIDQLGQMVFGLPPVSLVSHPQQANVTLTFAPLDTLGTALPTYVSGNWGFFSFWNDADGVIYEAQAVIASDVTSQQDRNHLILEEFTGLLGLANDIEGQPDSIIYQPWTTTQQLSLLDWQLLNLLYDERLSPGMSQAQAFEAMGWGRVPPLP